MDREEVGYADHGSISRFYKACDYSEEERRIFYCGKVSPKERGNSKHPCIKPISLMRYLIRLICPRGGTVLDPFAGTGTTGVAAIEEGMSAILIEREKAYIKDCRNRLEFFLDT
jgi:DNA modification methylase